MKVPSRREGGARAIRAPAFRMSCLQRASAIDFGRCAGKMINKIALAMVAGLRRLSRRIHAHPTQSEVVRQVAQACEQQPCRSGAGDEKGNPHEHRRH